MIDASTLGIVHHPDPVLRRKAERIAAITPEVRSVAARMIEVMREEAGIGLAAPQVGVTWRLFVADVPRSKDDPGGELPTSTSGPIVYVNPVLSRPVGPPEAMDEGCLSLPEIRGDVLRPPVITLTWQELDGATKTLTAAGLLARCWQHEMDHLDGVLIIDRFTQTSRLKNRVAIRNLERG